MLTHWGTLRVYRVVEVAILDDPRGGMIPAGIYAVAYSLLLSSHVGWGTMGLNRKCSLHHRPIPYFGDSTNLDPSSAWPSLVLSLSPSMTVARDSSVVVPSTDLGVRAQYPQRSIEHSSLCSYPGTTPDVLRSLSSWALFLLLMLFLLMRKP